MSKLQDYAEKQKQGVPNKLDSIEGQPVTVNSVSFNTGRFGTYAVMQVAINGGEVVPIMTGATLVIDALQHAYAEEAFPLEATFTRKGRVWIIS